MLTHPKGILPEWERFTDDQKAYWIGKEYEQQKKPASRPHKEGQPFDHQKTRETVAKQYRVGETTVQRNAQFARDMDAIAKAAGDDARNRILEHDIQLTRQQVEQIAKIAAAKPQTVKNLLSEIKANRQDTKRIIREAVRHLSKYKPRPAPNFQKRFRERYLSYIDALLKEPQPVSLARIAVLCDMTPMNLLKNSILQFMALLPWLEITFPKSQQTRQSSPKLLFYHFKAKSWMRTLYEGRGPQPSAQLKEVIAALGDLRRMIDHERKEANARRDDSKWNPEIVHANELKILVDQIETGLDAICQLGKPERNR